MASNHDLKKLLSKFSCADVRKEFPAFIRFPVTSTAASQGVLEVVIGFVYVCLRCVAAGWSAVSVPVDAGIVMTQPEESDSDSWLAVLPNFNESWQVFDLSVLTADDTRELSLLEQQYHGNMPEHVAVADVKQEVIDAQSTGRVAPNTNCANHSLDDWPGKEGFRVMFMHQVPNNNAWTYADERKKLYTMMDSVVSLQFATDQPPPPGTTVCIVAVFRDPNLRLKRIQRCPYHAQKSSDGALKDHWILCDHHGTVYSEDEANEQRNFLTVPFEAPVGNDNDRFTYGLRFMCLNSCAGYINRRATNLFFILRSPEGREIARRVVEVKVCACPLRDRRRDDRNNKREFSIVHKPSCSTVPADDRLAGTGHISSDADATSRRKHGKRKVYTIEVYDKDRYELLRKIRDALETYEAAKKKKKSSRQGIASTDEDSER